MLVWLSSVGLAATVEAAGERCTVLTEGLSPEWAPAYARLCDTVLEGYQTVLGFVLPAMRVEIRVRPDEPHKLWTDYDSIQLRLPDPAHLQPGSPYRSIYGVAHEAGHVVLRHDLAMSARQIEDLHEAWAHYAGSVVTDHVWQTLGPDGWPVPHDYSQHGLAYLERQCEQQEIPKDSWDCLFLTLHQRYGARAVADAVRSANKDVRVGIEWVRGLRIAMHDRYGKEALALFQGFPTRLW